MNEKEFPIMGKNSALLRTIPWSLLETHEKQVLNNHNQTLTRLAQRGGLSECEAVAIIEDREYRHMTNASERLSELVEQHLQLCQPSDRVCPR